MMEGCNGGVVQRVSIWHANLPKAVNAAWKQVRFCRFHHSYDGNRRRSVKIVHEDGGF
jgi:hypothetical protein